MFVEEFEDLKFESNKGRDAFIEQILNSLNPIINEFKLNEISKLIETD